MRNTNSTVAIVKSELDVYILYRRRFYVLGIISFLTFNQCVFWLTFSPASPSTQKFYGISSTTVDLLFNWGPIIFIPCLPLTYLFLNRRNGLRHTVILLALAGFIATFLRVLPSIISSTSSSRFRTISMPFLHTGQIINATCGPLVMAPVSQLSCLWFGPNERTLATTLAIMANVFGSTISFLINPAIVSRSSNLPHLLYFHLALAVVAGFLALIYFPAQPPTAPSAAVKLLMQGEGQSINTGLKAYLKGLRECMANPSFVLLSTAGGVMAGTFSMWTGLFATILAPENYSKKQAAISTNVSSIISFVDISVKSGITYDNYVINPANPIPINDHSRLAFVDINGDGWDDIVMHSLYPNLQRNISLEHLVFVNNRNGTFTHFSDVSGLRHVQAGFFVFGDIDNDGDQDVFTGLDYPTVGLTNHIYLNDGNGHFTELHNSGTEGNAGDSTAASASFADFNNDGILDLYLGNGGSLKGVADQLFFGKGDGTFDEVTANNLLGINPKQPTNGVVVCDYDNDGDVDIFVSTYGVSIALGHNILWENDGTGKFTNVASSRGFLAQATGNYWLSSTGNGTFFESDKNVSSYVGSNGFGIDCEDVNGDGLNDIFLATISHPVDSDYNRKWSDPTQLLISHLVNGTRHIFVNEFLQRHLPFNEGDIDAGFVDFDNDGRLDLALTRDTKYESKYTAFDQLAWFGLMHQKNDGNFEILGAISGINDLQATGKAARMKGAQNFGWSDIDHDGDLDLLVGGRDQGGGRTNFLFENTVGQEKSWLAIKLIGDGINVNRDAIGARVTLRFSNWMMMREMKSSRGTYSSADTRVLHFGLGDFGEKFMIEVRWPDGTLQTYNSNMLVLNRFIVIDYDRGLQSQSCGATCFHRKCILYCTVLCLFYALFLSRIHQN
ncbi:unnamed protein product [Rotaria sp. Silwood2]|nr:unnamed protein product [Rotaria sp. Silwood2]CAF4194720.1 unnamed protein product [Rotaria sp. Silwood2]